MVELTVRLGQKGQIVIPKIFRDAYKMYPLQEITIKTETEGVLLKQKTKGIAQDLKELAKEAAKRRNDKPFVYKKEEFYEQYDERTKRAGIKI